MTMKERKMIKEKTLKQVLVSLNEKVEKIEKIIISSKKKEKKIF